MMATKKNFQKQLMHQSGVVLKCGYNLLQSIEEINSKTNQCRIDNEEGGFSLTLPPRPDQVLPNHYLQPHEPRRIKPCLAEQNSEKLHNCPLENKLILPNLPNTTNMLHELPETEKLSHEKRLMLPKIP